jgi:hypothetical protein
MLTNKNDAPLPEDCPRCNGQTEWKTVNKIAECYFCGCTFVTTGKKLLNSQKQNLR